MAKQPRKVSNINVADYPREKFSAYWLIHVDGNDVDGYRWQAHVYSRQPIAWDYAGKRTKERPDVPPPAYPPDIPVSDAMYRTLKPEEQAKVRAAQEERRSQIRALHAKQPQAVTLLEETMGTTDHRDTADAAAQAWVAKAMMKYAIKGEHSKPAGQRGYALTLGPLDMASAILAGAWRRLVLFALAFASALRTTRAGNIGTAIDAGAGAGLLRIYDGSRPATCGTATTLGAELTFADPSGSASGGVWTANAITKDSSANASITATWWRAVDSTGTCVMDGNCGTSGSDMNMNTTTIALAQEVSCSSFAITEGNA